MQPRTLDHVALWTDERDAIADFAVAHLGMHLIERTDRFTLVGRDARRGKLTLFAADGPRAPGALVHVGLRVSRLGAALRGMPGRDGGRAGSARVDAPGGLRVVVVEAPTDSEWDLDHVALRSADPQAATAEYGRLGFAPAPPTADGNPRVGVGGAFVELWPGGEGAEPERPLLNHVAVLVDSAEEHRTEAEELGVEVDEWVDGPNTLAVFLRGPDGVRIEYVEHKPTFSLV
ncbi:MAG: VOC family protein [Thermoleophilia bacterium]|nr:VOC family protein [Thermoleophilia bacterium]